jgi:hypothetical protein
MNWKGYGRERSWSILGHYPGICLKWMRNYHEEASVSAVGVPSQDLNLEYPDYKSEALPQEQTFTLLVVLRLAVYPQSVRLGDKPLETHDQ